MSVELPESSNKAGRINEALCPESGFALILLEGNHATVVTKCGIALTGLFYRHRSLTFAATLLMGTGIR
jgi:hypothetical protein